MATFDVRQPRRKLATYGKATRKRFLNVDDEARRAPSNSRQIWDLPDDRADAGSDDEEPHVSASDKFTKSDGVPRGERTGGVSTASPKAAVKQHVLGKAELLGGRRHDRGAPTAEREDGLNQAGGGKEVFEIPSSDEETQATVMGPSHTPSQGLPRITQSHRSPRGISDSETSVSSPKTNGLQTPGKDGTETPPKRQKKTPDLVDTGLPAVYDDDALQRHIAMESLNDETSGQVCVPGKAKAPAGRKGSEGQDLAMRSRKQQSSHAQTQKSETASIKSGQLSPAQAASTALKPSPVFKSTTSGQIENRAPPEKQGEIKKASEAGRRRRGPDVERKPPRNGGTSISPHTPSRPPSHKTIAVEITPSRLQMGSLQLSPAERKIDNASTNLASRARAGVEHAPPKVGSGRKKGRRLIDSLADQASTVSRDSVPDDTANNGAGSPDSASSSSLSEDELTAGAEDVVMHDDHREEATEAAPASQPSSQGALPSSQGGPKITYAQQRSFLSEAAVDEATMLNTPLDVGVSLDGRHGLTGGRRQLRPPPQIVDQGEEDAEENPSGAIRSIHELRHAGGNKRFLDESEALFEDIENRKSSSISSRRSGLLNVGKKMVEKSYAQQFVDRDLDRRLLNRLDGEDDVIICFAVASIIALLIHHGLGDLSLAHILQEGSVALLNRLLEFDKSVRAITRDRRTNMSKFAQSLAVDFATNVCQALLSASGDDTPVSPRLVSLLCLRLITKQSRDTGETGDVLSPEVVHALAGLLDKTSTWTAEDPPSSEELVEVELTVAILETYTLNVGNLTDKSIQAVFSSPVVVRLLPSVCQYRSDDFQALQLVTLRLLLNVTNRRPGICRKIATAENFRALVQVTKAGFETVSDTSDDDERMTSVDTLILALATLTNLAEWTNETESSIWLADSGQGNLLDDLLTLLVHGFGKSSEADSMEETQSNVALGYLAVLFSVLCLQPEVRRYTTSRLPGKTMQPLVAAVEEFLQYHQRVDDQLRKEGLGGEAQDGFKERLQANLDSLKRSS